MYRLNKMNNKLDTLIRRLNEFFKKKILTIRVIDINIKRY